MKALYVHIPFCNHICSYCDFSKVFYKESWVDDYLDALAYEIADKQLNGSFETVYIGGGTPSCLNYKQLEHLLELLKPLTYHVKEYSIEVNPESVDEDKVKLMKKYHINRVSIGVQSFNDEILSKINRYHHKEMAIQCIQLFQHYGINDINVDLMYGLPLQTVEDVSDDLKLIKQLDINHVSVYSLILEDHTVLKNNGYKPLDDETDAYFYEMIHRTLENEGFYHYEVSNFYKNKPSLHNLVYWHYEDYEGIGLSAHSLKKHCRYENTRSLTKYLNHEYLDVKEILTQDDEMFEMIMMGLRLSEGVCLQRFNDRFHCDFYAMHQNIIDRFIEMGLLLIEDGYLKTSFLGVQYLNTILIEFMK